MLTHLNTLHLTLTLKSLLFGLICLQGTAVAA